MNLHEIEEAIRELEQGKESCRMDKVNQALSMFGSCLGVIKKTSLQGEGVE